MIMAHFHPLTVTNVRKTTRDAVEVTLEAPEDADFSFIQGQYLTFRRKFEGTEIRRSYSICAGRNEHSLKVGIKRVDGGVFSTWANTDLSPGMTLDAMPPMGSFHTPIDKAASRHYLGFAGGSGITPVLSIMKTVLAEEPGSNFTLVYANRAPHTIMFREEIEDLKNTHLGRLSVVHVLESDAADIELFRGRVDAEKCAALFETLVDITTVHTAFICGPEPMMLSISAALKDHGLAVDQIKFELFASSQPGRLERPAHLATRDTPAGIEAIVIVDGESRSFTMGAQESLLEAALENTLDVPFACKAGVCSTCKCRVLEGEVEMAANHALEDYEVERGFVLSCQSFVLSDRIVVDYDQH